MMHPLRFWTSTALAFLLGIAMTACSDDPGRQAYLDTGCQSCHDRDLSGTAKGPPLKNLQANWTREELVNYLKNPAGYVSRDERLLELGRRYKQTMPDFQHPALPEDKLYMIADYILKASEE